MDRQAWIAVTLCILGLIAWQFYMTTHAPPPRPARASASPAAPPPDAVARSSAPAPPVSGSTRSSTPGTPSLPVGSGTPEPAAPYIERTETLRNGDVELRLTNRGGAISEALLLNHAAENGHKVMLNAADRTPIGAIVEQPAAPALQEFSIARQPDGSVQFERSGADRVTIRKKFSFAASPDAKDNFVALMDVELHNDGPEIFKQAGYFVTLGSATPIHLRDMPSYTRLVWCIAGKARSTDVGWFAEQNKFFGMQKRPAQEFYQEKLSGADWAGMSNQFFTTLVTPLNAKAIEVWGRRFETRGSEGLALPGIEGAMAMPAFELPPGESATLRFQIYTGPKLYGRLAKLEHNEAEIMNFGTWKLVSQTLLNLMNWLHGWVGNYAIAILLLTAIIKGVLWPLQNKANKSMRRMSSLSPKMQELREKYKDDPTRMNQEVMKLYKEHGVNPVGGCLPMMIQIPIFFGLLSMLGQAVELRNARFLWVHDLSQPDTVAHIPGLDWPLNILPLLMGLTNVWLMRMTPKTGDTTQQKVMMFMPLIFLFFCYNFAAALALYYTTQNLFTILQLWQNQRQPAPVLEKVASAGKRSRKGRP
ncbi:MAG: membrane protein insertase YidC [Chthoniobacterales bacterium]